MPGNIYVPLVLSAATLTDSIQNAAQLQGQPCDNMTLTGFYLASAASATVTLTACPILLGTYVPVVDPFGTISTAGTPITWTLATTGSGAGFYYVPPVISAGFTHIKFKFALSETMTMTAVLRSIP